MKRIYPVFLLCFLQIGCSFFEKKVDVTPLPPSEDIRSEQEQWLKEADGFFEKKDYKSSLEKYESFIQKNPQSIFLVQAHLGLARNYMALLQWQKAIDSFRSILRLTIEKQPELVAESLYSMSYCYEMLGEELKLFTTLKDTEKLRQHLSDEIRLAELPARLASAYYKSGDEITADRYFQEADQGMAQIKAQKGDKISKSWISKTYFQMGGMISSQLSSNNLKAHIESLGKMQLFTLKAVEENGEPWSDRAADNIRRNYMDIWIVIENWPKDSNLDPMAAHRNQIQKQAELFVELLNTIEKFRTYVVPESQEKNKTVGALLSFLNEMEVRARNFIMNSGVYNELTPESRIRW